MLSLDILTHVIDTIDVVEDQWRLVLTMRSVSTLIRRAALEWATHTTSIRLDVSYGRMHMSMAAAAVHMCPHLRALELCGPCASIDLASMFRCAQLDRGASEPSNRKLELTRVDVTKCLCVTGLESFVRTCPLLTHVNLSECANVTDADVRIIATCCSSRLEHLDLKICRRVTDASVVFVATRCPNLTYLDVSGCPRVSDVGIRAIALYCTKLVHVDVRMCFDDLSDQSLVAFSRNCPALTHFAAQNSCSLEGEGVLALASRCTRLSHLQLFHCGGSVAGLSAFNGTTSLTSLDLRGCSGVDDACIVGIVEKCTASLTSLSVQMCDDVTDATALALSRHCPELVHLDVGRCGVSDVGIDAVVRRCKKLVSLYVRGCKLVTDVFTIAHQCSTLERVACPPRTTDASLGVVANHCVSLTHLHVTSCDVVGSGMVACARNGKLTHLTCPVGMSDATLCAIATSSPRLEEVNLGRCSDDVDCDGVTDVGVLTLASNCAHLKRAILPATVTDVGVNGLVSKCGHSLELLDVSRCELQSATMSAIAHHCSRLVYLSCGRVSDANVGCISRHCPELTHLIVSGAFDGMSDVGVLALARHSMRLTTLKLPSCEGITNVGVSALRSCHHLTGLSVHECPNVTQAAVDELRTALPHLKVYTR